jgi:sucrose-6-phosphatase
VCIEGRELPQWTERFEGWDRGVVDRLMADLGFEPHPPELQTPFKASFRVPQPQWTAARAAIAQTGLPAQVITSGSSDFDVLPPAAGKGSATLFLTEHLGVPIERLIVAGDSGNDAAMFRISPRGIVVGNARPELCGAVDRSRVYFARGARAAGLLEGLVHYRAVGGGAPRTTENDSLFSPSSA